MAVSVVMPALEMAQETGKLVSWLKQEGEHVRKGEMLLEVETDKAVMEIFLKSLRASLPQVSDADLQWRMEFVWGALAFILCNPHTIAMQTHGACNPVDASKVLSEMIKFFSAGFRAAALPRAVS